MYKVYEIDSAICYHGMSLVAAENAIEANKIIDDFIRSDENNVYDSHGYCHVNESDCIEPFHSELVICNFLHHAIIIFLCPYADRTPQRSTGSYQEAQRVISLLRHSTI